MAKAPDSAKGLVQDGAVRDGVSMSRDNNVQTPTAFRDYFLNCRSREKLWAKLSAYVAHLNSNRVIAGDTSIASRACPAFCVQTAWELLKKCMRFLQARFEFLFMCLLYFKSLGYAGIMVGGNCGVLFIFFPTAATEKKHCVFSYTIKEYYLIHVSKN